MIHPEVFRMTLLGALFLSLWTLFAYCIGVTMGIFVERFLWGDDPPK